MIQKYNSAQDKKRDNIERCTRGTDMMDVASQQRAARYKLASLNSGGGLFLTLLLLLENENEHPPYTYRSHTYV